VFEQAREGVMKYHLPGDGDGWIDERFVSLGRGKNFFLDEVEFGFNFNVGPLPGLGFSL